ncbi:amino acid adenylation [Aureobasidium pullulans]|uniref:Amino acid adenylation n=1 Tax=Aureobasidium pullulans TaxID=5580 RepID=A0A4S9LUN5_AURPU|nr:amino acid adenylation [Aureobasidium pullulans]
MVPTDDLNTIWKWNSHLPTRINASVLEILRRSFANLPSAVAIDAWDGTFTYNELDRLSDGLAAQLHLQSLVFPGAIVPLCFEKSRWCPVALLAVMKAGGASVLLDLDQVNTRLQSVIDQIKPSIILSSDGGRTVAGEIAPSIKLISVGDHFESAVKLKHERYNLPTSIVSPSGSSLLYIIFTSGSTGNPKGIRITHANWASAWYHQAKAVGIRPDSRVYDFSAYSFDVTWCNLVHALAAGACLCIPSREERKSDVATSIHKFRATDVILTPTTARIFQPESVPTLRNLLLIGEKPRKQDLEVWKSILKIVYGPSECTTFVTGIENEDISDTPGAIGRGLGAHTWILDETGSKLVPLGDVGELWLEGPLVGSGYLDDHVKTAAAFVENPVWLIEGSQVHCGRRGRLYRTGDLVKYDTQGSFVFVCRRDSQVKIRGQRVELGEIEHHIRGCISTSDASFEAIVECIATSSTDEPRLVAFVAPTASSENLQADTNASVKFALQDLEGKLSKLMPPYMIPSSYIPMAAIPTGPTGKTDRKELRNIGANLDLSAFRLRSTDSGSLAARSLTDMEKRLAVRWAEVLNVQASDIEAHDSFIQLGGDSIHAMNLIRIAHKHGLVFTVADVLRNTALSDLANVVKEKEPSLEGNSVCTVAGTKQRPSDFVLDFPGALKTLPVTYIQEHCLGPAMLEPAQGSYLFYMDFPPTFSTEQVMSAVEATWKNLDTLRVVFIRDQHGYRQYFVNDPPPTEVMLANSDLGAFSEAVFTPMISQPTRLNEIYTRFLIIEDLYGNKRLGLRLNHAQFDGFSEGILRQCLSASAKGEVLQARTGSADYMLHVTEREEATLNHWTAFLQGSEPLPLFDTETFLPPKINLESNSVKTPANDLFHAPTDVFVAACASLLSKRHAKEDVVFSTVVSGRSSLPPHLSDTATPCLNIIPFRVTVHKDESLQDIIPRVRAQRIANLEYEIATTSNILEICTTWPVHERRFTYTVLFQYSNDQDGHSAEYALNMFGSTGPLESEEGVLLVAVPRQDEWVVTVAGNQKFCRKEEVGLMLRQLTSILNNLTSN